MSGENNQQLLENLRNQIEDLEKIKNRWDGLSSTVPHEKVGRLQELAGTLDQERAGYQAARMPSYKGDDKNRRMWHEVYLAALKEYTNFVKPHMPDPSLTPDPKPTFLQKAGAAVFTVIRLLLQPFKKLSQWLARRGQGDGVTPEDDANLRRADTEQSVVSAGQALADEALASSAPLVGRVPSNPQRESVTSETSDLTESNKHSKRP